MMQNFFRYVITTILCLLSIDNLFGQTVPRTFIIDPQVIAAVRNDIQKGNEKYALALKSLRKNADKALKTPAVSVMEKKQVPPSGDKHDYMSIGRYWWPNPETKNGLPYIRHDGEVNPEIKDITDHEYLLIMTKNVSLLSAAYYYLGDEEYAMHANKLIRTWFLDSLSRMNPNLNYSQGVPGREDGRGAGVIDAHTFCELIDALGLLSESPSFSNQDRAGILKWFREYLHWLRESKNGKEEAQAKNNHGSWYEVQVVSIALFIGDVDLARTILTQTRDQRIAAQIEPDGTQPNELERTRSFGYSMFNLKALANLSLLGERVGVDLWHYETKDGRSIRKALDYLLPYITADKSWDYKQISEVKMSDMYPLLLDAARVYQDKKYSDAASKIPDAPKLSQKSILFLGQQ
jgi:hypothetical protein